MIKLKGVCFGSLTYKAPKYNGSRFEIGLTSGTK